MFKLQNTITTCCYTCLYLYLLFNLLNLLVFCLLIEFNWACTIDKSKPTHVLIDFTNCWTQSIKAALLMFVLIVLEFWSLSQGHRLTGDVKCVQVLNKKVWLEKKFLVRVLYLFRRNRLFSLLWEDQFYLVNQLYDSKILSEVNNHTSQEQNI